MNGVLVVDKPVGPTSHDVVFRARRALGTRRIGHTGTLDPLASGVLPLVVGQATRLARFLSGTDKTYLADVRFGSATTTYDAGGEPLGGVTTVAVDGAALDAALDEFRGARMQVPPPFSAKKVAGTPAYALARQGRAPVLAPVAVTVHALDVVGVEGSMARLHVRCSAGFYVRTLAHELGRTLGCGAHLAALRRLQAGPFGLAQAVTLDALEARGPSAAAGLIPLDALLPELPHVVLTDDGRRRARHGSPISSADLVPGTGAGGFDAPAIRLLDAGGGLVGIAEPGGPGVLHPSIVLV